MPLNVLAGILAVLCGGQVVTTLRDYQVCPREGCTNSLSKSPAALPTYYTNSVQDFLSEVHD